MPTRSRRDLGRQAPRSGRHRASAKLDSHGSKKSKKDTKKKKKKRGSKLEYKRVDQLWDNTIHNYKLSDTAEDEESSEYDQYLFNVRRTFDWEGKYKVGFLVFLWLPTHTDIYNRQRLLISRASCSRML
jgi:hypothetical protein